MTEPAGREYDERDVSHAELMAAATALAAVLGIDYVGLRATALAVLVSAGRARQRAAVSRETRATATASNPPALPNLEPGRTLVAVFTRAGRRLSSWQELPASFTVTWTADETWDEPMAYAVASDPDFVLWGMIPVRTLDVHPGTVVSVLLGEPARTPW